MPGTGDVKIRVLCAGICGGELHILNGDASAVDMCDADMCDSVPFIPGHEIYGEVVEAVEQIVDV